MSRRLYRFIFITTLIFILLVFIFLIIISFDAAGETDDWKFLDLDFTNKDNIIAAYGGLLGSILSFIAILFVILDLVYQRRQKTLESEEKEEIRLQELRDSLGITKVYVERLHKNNIDQSERALAYASEEMSKPTEMNRMSFFPNTFPKLILEIDRHNIFRALREFKPGNEWKKIFVDLYKIADFYNKSIEEITNKHQIHLNKKYKHNSAIATNLDILIDEVSNVRNDIIGNNTGHHSTLLENPYFLIVNDFKEKTITLTEDRKEKLSSGVNPEEVSSGLSEFRNDIVGPLFTSIMERYRADRSLPSEFNGLLTKAQEYMRQTEKLIKDSTDYANHINYYNKEYLDKESKYQIRLLEISNTLESFV